MANGTKTGMETGKVPARTPGNKSLFIRLLRSWIKLTPKKKMAYLIVAAGFILLMVMVAVNPGCGVRYVELYPNLSASDAKAIMMRLEEWKVDYRSDGTKVMVLPAQKAKLQIQLQVYGIPHQPVYAQPEDKRGLSPGEQAEKDYQRIQQLQADIVNAIRQVDGVADAAVKISLLIDGTRAATAAVMIKMKAGARLGRDYVNGIINFVAYSVPELTPENVKVMDTRGIVLNDRPTILFEEQDTKGEELEIQASFERELTKKVQEELDRILGPGKSLITVSVDLDFKAMKENAKKMDDGKKPVKIKKDVKKIGTGNGTESETYQMSLPSGTGSSGKMYYHPGYPPGDPRPPRKSLMEECTPAGVIIKRITASVALDSSVANQAGELEKFVKGALGYDASRGDSVTVLVLPFDVNYIDQMQTEMLYASNPRPGTSSTLLNLPVTISLIVIAALLVVLTILIMKRKRAQAGKSKL